MRTFRTDTAILCTLLALAPALPAQQIQHRMVDQEQPTTFRDRLKWPYQPRQVRPINLANSNRLESLLRAGKLYLSLRDAIALALENNLDIELQRYGPEIAAASLMRAEAGGLLRGVPPTVQAGPQSAQAQVTGSQTGGGGGGGGRVRDLDGGGSTGGTIITTTGSAFQNLDPVFVSTFNMGHTTRPQSNTVTTGLTSTVFNSTSHSYAVQKSWLSGTTASVAWNNTAAKSNNPLSDINPFTSSNVQLQIQQRLLQGFGVAVNNRNIRIARNNLKVTDLQFRQQLIVTVSAVTNLYWDLVSFNEDVSVREKSVSLAQKLYEDNKKQVEIGTLAPIEIVSAEAEVARRQQELTVAETVLLQQETIIKNALSRTGVNPMIAEARIVPVDRIRFSDEAPPSIEDLFKQALDARPDLAQTKINIENAKIGLKGSKSQLLPSLDVQANFQNNALAGEVNELLLRGRPVPRQVDSFFVGGFGTTVAQLARRNFPDYAVGFQLNIPIRNRSAQADFIIDSLNVRQAELNEQRTMNQLRVDVQNAVIGLTQAKARYQTAMKERVLQEQTLDAEEKKYGLGASTVFFVIRYQRDLAQAQSNEVAALSIYQKARTQLEQVTAQTLKVNDIDVVEAMSGRMSWASTPPPPEPRKP